MTENGYDIDAEMEKFGECLEHLFTHEKHLETASIKTMNRFKEFFVDKSPCDNDCAADPEALKKLTIAWLESIETLYDCKDDIKVMLEAGGHIYDFFLRSYGALKELEKSLSEETKYEE